VLDKQFDRTAGEDVPLHHIVALNRGGDEEELLVRLLDAVQRELEHERKEADKCDGALAD
jgi:hypothetical protein